MHRVPTYVLLAALSWLASCSSKQKRLEGQHPEELVGNWIRSDDYAESRGLNVYTLGQDGRIYLTYYSDRSWSRVLSRKKDAGRWEVKDGVLVWTIRGPERTITITYTRDRNERYVETNGSYYVPVKLIPVRMKHGKPFVE